MKRACPGLVESRRPRSIPPPRVSVFLDPAYLRLDVLVGNSLLTILSGRIEAGLGVHIAHNDFRRARGIPRFTLAM